MLNKIVCKEVAIHYQKFYTALIKLSAFKLKGNRGKSG